MVKLKIFTDKNIYERSSHNDTRISDIESEMDEWLESMKGKIEVIDYIISASNDSSHNNYVTSVVIGIKYREIQIPYEKFRD